MQGTIRQYDLSYHEECEIVVARNVDLVVPRHLHTSYCLGVQEAGIRRLQLGVREHTACAGDVILICAGAAHACETLSESGESYSILSFPAQCLHRVVPDPAAEFLSALASLPPVLQDRRLHEALLRFFMSVRRLRSPAEEAASLDDVFAALLEHAQASSISLRRAGKGPAVRVIGQAQAYLRSHFKEDVSLSDLSAAVCMSPYHLSRRFCREVGVSPHTYLTLLRLKEARRQLKDGASLADAAQNCGFYDQAHFTHAFRKYNGVPPGHFLCEDGSACA